MVPLALRLYHKQVEEWHNGDAVDRGLTFSNMPHLGKIRGGRHDGVNPHVAPVSISTTGGDSRGSHESHRVVWRAQASIGHPC